MTLARRFDAPVWDKLLTRCLAELGELPTAERHWLSSRLEDVGELQTELDRLFRTAGGELLCCQCQGSCCDCGLHHFTLTNLLGYLLEDALPPRPDVTRPCPFLGAAGCTLAVSCRPFNCITFLCDSVEAGLNPADRQHFYQVERQLRVIYEQIAGRYPVASLRGLLIALERHGEQTLLKPVAGQE